MVAIEYRTYEANQKSSNSTILQQASKFMLSKIILYIVLYWSYKFLNNKSHRGYKLFLILAGMLLTAQSGLRNYAVGADTYQYYLMFEDVFTKSWTDIFQAFTNYYQYGVGKDPGYDLLMKVFQIVFPDFRCFLIAIAAFYFAGMLKLFHKYKLDMKSVLISIALYQALFYSFFSITGIRQTIAAAVTLWVIPAAVERKFWKFLIPILIVSTIHKSALLFIPFYLFGYIKNPKLAIIGALILFVPMWIGGQGFVQLLIADTIFNQYEDYLEGYDTQGALTFALFIILVAFTLLMKFKKLEHKVGFRIFACAIAFAVFYTPMTSVGPSQMRIVQYYSILLLIMLPWLIKNIGNNKYSNAVLLFFVCYSLYNDPPYAFFWQDMNLGANYQFSKIISGW